MTKPVLIILVGLPGTGKSTFRNKLREVFEFTSISSDDYIDDVAKYQGKTYAEVFEDAVGPANVYVEETAKKAFAAKANVVWDQTNLSAKKRKKVLDKFNGYDKLCVVFDISPSDQYKRLYKRVGETGKYIPLHILENMHKTAEMPTEEEGFSKIFWNIYADNLIDYLKLRS